MPIDRSNLVSEVLNGDDRTVEALQPVLQYLKELQLEKNKDLLELTSTKLWLSTRQEEWRIPFGEAGILHFFHSLIPEAINSDLTSNCLKIIGNCCAEKDANRQRVIDHPLSLSPIIYLVPNPVFMGVSTVVLFNIITDFEPAQLAAIENKACSTIISLIDSRDFSSSPDFLIRILELLLAHDAGKAETPETSIESLLRILELPETSFDNFLAVVTMIATLLSTPRFQKVILAKEDLLPRIFDLLEQTYTLANPTQREAKEISLVSYARGKLVEAIGDFAAHNEFLDIYSLEGPVMTRVRDWLKIVPGKEELTVASCLVYGNIGRSDDVCYKIVNAGVHLPMLEIIKDTVKIYEESRPAALNQAKDSLAKKSEEEKGEEGGTVITPPTGAMAVGVIHAAVGVLKNLAIPPQNKKLLVDSNAFDAVHQMLKMEGVGVGQVWYSAVGLGRLAVIGTVENARRIMESNSNEPSLLSLFLERYNEVEELPVKTEISRTIGAILRIVYNQEEPNRSLLDRLLTHSNLENVLWDMVKQDKYNVVRSEGWFALALMVRSPEGASRLIDVLDEELVKKTLEEGVRQDRDNAGVFVIEMKNNVPEEKREVLNRLIQIFLKMSGAVFESV